MILYSKLQQEFASRITGNIETTKRHPLFIDLRDEAGP